MTYHLLFCNRQSVLFTIVDDTSTMSSACRMLPNILEATSGEDITRVSTFSFFPVTIFGIVCLAVLLGSWTTRLFKDHHRDFILSSAILIVV